MAPENAEKKDPNGKINEKTGLPLFDDDAEKAKAGKKGFVTVVIIHLIFTLLGVGIAYLIYKFGSTEDYDRAIKMWKGGKDADYKWPWLAIIIYCYMVVFLNMWPVYFKEQVMRGGNLRANQFLLRTAVGNQDEVSAVVLYEDGDKGLYNRANRSIYHFLENGLPLVVCMPGSFLIFPFPAFVVVTCYAIGRILYQLGYTLKGFGAHTPGFFIDRFATFTLIGFHILTFIFMTFPMEDEENKPPKPN